MSNVTYTSISSDYEEPSDADSPRVIVYGYDGLPMHPVDPPSLDYVPSPKEPEQALLSPDYVPGPDYPEYLAPSDDELLVEDQPHDVDALPIALSPGYISSRDDADEEEVEEASKEDEEEEHLAPADSTVVSPVVDPVPSAKETEPFETDESAATPPPPPAYRTTARMSIRAQAHIPFPSEAKIMEKKIVIARLNKVSSQDGDYLVIYRANGNFKAFNYLIEVLHIFDRQDLFHLYDLMREQYSEVTLDGFALILWGDLKIMMESSTKGNEQNDFWSGQQDWKIVQWR
ncbi:hypothetical protein Tco_1519733, partial [Tanacetum coccineum]